MTTHYKTPLDIFYHWERTRPDHIFLRQPVDGHWHEYSFQNAGDEIRRIAATLKTLNLPPQSNIAILSKNCAHWIMTDLAIWMAGHVSVPIYPTLSAPAIKQILEHSDSKAIFIGKLDDYASQKDGVPESLFKISFPFYKENVGARWSDLLQKHDPLQGEINVKGNQLSTIMYTSGTTGRPKGVMVTFEAFAFVISNAIKNFNIKSEGQKFFSYLPLSHIAERMLVEMGGLYSGGTISFSESLEKFPQNLKDTQPTLFVAVPRIWSKFQEKILEKMPQKKLDRLLKIPIINSLIKNTIKKNLGLSQATWIFTGAAPIPVSLLEWFKKIGIEIHEVYGMTENLAYSHINLNKVKFGTVGPPWPEVEVKLGEEGEIQTRHLGLMTGYYLEPELTTQVLTADGFLKTGDKGEIDSEDFLTITGRIKDQFKTDKAKFIDPAPIELSLLSNSDIEQVCVVGIGIPQPIALIVLSSAAKIKAKEIIDQSLAGTLSEINGALESYERLKAFVVMREEWTIENGLITPTLKVKRNELEKIHLSKYPKWYQQETIVVWE